MISNRSEILEQFGFTFNVGGAHLARTIMVDDLTRLLDYFEQPMTDQDAFQEAIVSENCLGKRSLRTRKLSFQYLCSLYSLDHALIFRSLLFFWKRDINSRSLVALLCAYARDAVLRSSAVFIQKYGFGSVITREALEDFLGSVYPNRFSSATLRSTAQNINSTWTKSGHLHGRARKVRTRPNPSAGSVAYALLLGYLTGSRGQSLFQTEYTKLLDCTFDTAIELAVEASRKGWIVFKRVGDVIEVLFPNLINQQEMELLREQS